MSKKRRNLYINRGMEIAKWAFRCVCLLLWVVMHPCLCRDRVLDLFVSLRVEQLTYSYSVLSVSWDRISQYTSKLPLNFRSSCLSCLLLELDTGSSDTGQLFSFFLKFLHLFIVCGGGAHTCEGLMTTGRSHFSLSLSRSQGPNSGVDWAEGCQHSEPPHLPCFFLFSLCFQCYIYVIIANLRS